MGTWIQPYIKDYAYDPGPFIEFLRIKLGLPAPLAPAAPSATGNVVQYIGVAQSATSIVFGNLLTIEVA